MTNPYLDYCLNAADPRCITATTAYEEGGFGVTRATVKRNLDKLAKEGYLEKWYEEKDSKIIMKLYKPNCRTVYCLKGHAPTNLHNRDVKVKFDLPAKIEAAYKTSEAYCESCQTKSVAPCTDGDAILCIPCAGKYGWNIKNTCIFSHSKEELIHEKGIR